MFPPPPSNGRVDLNQQIYSDFVSRGESNRLFDYTSDAVKGNVAADPVADLFFSRENIGLVQLGLKNMVLNHSCGKRRIGDQSMEELLQVMRAVYLQDALHQPYDYKGQVRRLNETVLRYCVPRILNEMEMHDTYLNELSRQPAPMKYGESTSVTGSKFLELKRF